MALFQKKTQEGVLLAPASGRLIPLESVPDEVFSQKILGDGFAVCPTSEEIFSPSDGVIETVSQNGHAVTLSTRDGLEILLHVGVDTVTMENSPFVLKVRQGDTVKAGQLLLTADLAAIKKAGLSTEIPVIVTNRECLSSLLTECGDCVGGQTVGASYRKS